MQYVFICMKQVSEAPPVPLSVYCGESRRTQVCKEHRGRFYTLILTPKVIYQNPAVYIAKESPIHTLT